jgi:hypothetical protein
LSGRAWRAGLKNREEVMEILEAFGLAGTLRGAADLVGCDHKTVAHWVRVRDEAGGGLPVAVRPRPCVDEVTRRSTSGSVAREARSAPTSATSGC